MKVIENWYAVLEDKYGDKKIALPLPGCIIEGNIGRDRVEIKTTDVDVSELTIIDIKGEKYKLLDANRNYLNLLNKCIEYNREKGKDGEER